MKTMILISLITFVSLASKAEINTDESLHKPMKRPIVTKVVGAIIGAPGKIANGISNWVERSQYSEEEGFKKSKYVYQCSAPLPTSRDSFPLNDLTQMYHTWLEVGVDSYGMPHTLNHKYFGGRAVIMNPDPFLQFTKESKVCHPVYQPVEMDEMEYAKKFKCVADKLSITDNVLNDTASQLNDGEPITVYFQYNALMNNCLSAAKFVTECASGRLSQNPNLGIGSDIESDTLEAKFYSENEKHSARSLAIIFNDVDKIIPRLDLKSVRSYRNNCKGENKSLCEDLRNQITKLYQSVADQLENVKGDEEQKLYKFASEKLSKIKDISKIDDFRGALIGLKKSIFYAQVTVPKSFTKVEICQSVRRSCGLE